MTETTDAAKTRRRYPSHRVAEVTTNIRTGEGTLTITLVEAHAGNGDVIDNAVLHPRRPGRPPALAHRIRGGRRCFPETGRD